MSSVDNCCVKLIYTYVPVIRVGVNSGIGVGVGFNSNSNSGVGIEVETSGVGVGVGVDIQEICRSWSRSWNSRSWRWIWSWNSRELELELELKFCQVDLYSSWIIWYIWLKTGSIISYLITRLSYRHYILSDVLKYEDPFTSRINNTSLEHKFVELYHLIFAS